MSAYEDGGERFLQHSASFVSCCFGLRRWTGVVSGEVVGRLPMWMEASSNRQADSVSKPLHQGSLTDEPVAEIVQCGEPPPKTLQITSIDRRPLPRRLRPTHQ